MGITVSILAGVSKLARTSLLELVARTGVAAETTTTTEATATATATATVTSIARCLVTVIESAVIAKAAETTFVELVASHTV